LSPAFQAQISKQATGTTAKGIKAAKLKDLLLPVPPRAEQKRIEEQIRLITPLINQYGALESARERLDAELPGKLRKSVLQLAVQGKLAPQDPADEPASALLERIRAERARLIKEKKVRAPKGGESVIWRASDGGHYEKRVDARGRESEPVCIDDEIPFEIPESWEWARMATVCNFGKCVNVEYDRVPVGTWNLDLEDLEKGTGRVLQKKRRGKGERGSTKHEFESGMVLYSKLRPYLNKVAIADESGVCTSEILPLRFEGLSAEYAQVVLMTPLFVEYAKAHSYGVKMPRLGTADGANFLVPIPPAAEQTRIFDCIAAYRALTNQ
jgi:type I restriction enzyme S subunit